jgi:hypothetical protein
MNAIPVSSADSLNTNLNRARLQERHDVQDLTRIQATCPIALKRRRIALTQFFRTIRVSTLHAIRGYVDRVSQRD